MTLTDLGWSHFFQQQVEPDEADLIPARVWRQDINQYHLVSADGELSGTLPGRFRQSALSKADLPTVGDWVLVSPIPGGEQGQVQIERLLDRKSRFSRKEAGDVVDEQIVAANIDTVFIVSSLDDDFNVNRLERYLLLSQDSGALPVIVLNKADICEDLEERLEALGHVTRGTPVHVVSAKDNAGVDIIKDYVGPGSTCALLGSSGVGKSTLINRLLGYDRFATGEVRETDSKGRHTTTFREMAMLPDGGMVIDTPGMRELQLWSNTTALEGTFDDIETLAMNCRFSDCQHQSEPGCAVKQAVASGELNAERLARFEKLQREVAHLVSQEDVAARTQRKQEFRRFSKLIRNRPDKRD
ncbi:MAG: ribosome small subunit-dependent GTPase A [Proteobacteria bacterium]|nr:ribosome small subunit-dependent GTPase A [Pseudomonadota bacterium]